MARPLKSPDSQRSKTAKFRVTEAEYVLLDQLATNEGQTVSDYVRGKALGAKPRVKKADPERQALIIALGNLGHIRSDINQILKDRQAHRFMEPKRVSRALAVIAELADRLYKQLEP